MAWSPKIAEGETVAVNVSVEARDGVHFGLVLSDRQLCFSRTKSGLVLSDAVETVSIPRSEIGDVTLVRRKSWFLRVIGVTLIAATAAYVIAFMAGELTSFSFGGLLGFVLGGACFTGGSNRWELTFTAAGKRYRILQPLSSSKALVDQMAGALQAAARDLVPEGSLSPLQP